MAGFYPTEPYIKRTWGVEEPDYDTYASDAFNPRGYRDRASVGVGSGSGMHLRSRPSSAGSAAGGLGRDRDPGRLDPLYNGGLTTPAGLGGGGAGGFGGDRDPRSALLGTPHSNFGADAYLPTQTDQLFKDDPTLAIGYGPAADANVSMELTLHSSANANANANGYGHAAADGGGYGQLSLYNPTAEVAQFNFEGRFERKLRERREMARRGYRLSLTSPWWTYGPWTDPDDADISASGGVGGLEGNTRRSDTIRFALKTLASVLVFLSMWHHNAFFTTAALILLGSDVPRRIRQNMSEKMKAPFEEFHPADLVPEVVLSFLMAWWFDSWATYVLVVGVSVFSTVSLIQMYWIFVEYWMVPGHVRYYGRKLHREATLENFMPLVLTLGSRMLYHAREGWTIIYGHAKSVIRSARESDLDEPRSKESPEPPRRRSSVELDRVPYGSRGSAGGTGRDSPTYERGGYDDRRQMTPTHNRRTGRDLSDAAPSPPRTPERPRVARPGKKPEFGANLVADDIRRLKRFLQGDPRGPRERKLGSILISHQLIQEMKPGELVEDSIIDGFVELLKMRNQQSQRRRERVPKCMFLPTSVFEFLKADSGAPEAWKMIEQADNRGDIFSYDRVFVPVNADERHWTVVEIDFKRKCMFYYDSAVRESPDVRVVNAINGLLAWTARKRRMEFSDFEAKFLSASEVPMQRNDFDCGIFVILYMMFRSEDLPVNFDPIYVSNFRARIALSLIDGVVESNL